MASYALEDVVRPRLALEVVGLLLLYCVGLGIYRLFLDPLSKFPGPKLGALSLWYEFYYDVIKRGRYTWEIEKMHEQYGPIVRISPYELHIKDADYHDQLYPGPSVRKTNKYHWTMKMFGPSQSTFQTADHDLHHIRRAALMPFFSTASVKKVEPLIQEVADKFTARLYGLKGSGKPINLLDVFSSFTGDVTGQYAFNKDFGYLDTPDFAPWWHQTIMDFSENGHKFKQFEWLEPLQRNLPRWFVKIVNPQALSIFAMNERMDFQIAEAKANIAKDEKPVGHRTIFYELLTNDQIPAQEREQGRIRTEAQSVTVAGTVTAANILSNIAFHIIDNPPVLEKLQAELKTVMPTNDTKPHWDQLKNLPYLAACINEGLRISYGVIHRLQRISPDVPIQYKQYSIPANTPVGMSPKFMHDDPEVYPNPRAFIPERFIQPKDPRVYKHMIVFGKGSRGCIGRDLASCEMNLCLANMFAPDRFKFEMFESDVTDIEPAHDFFNPSPKIDSKGLRAVVK